MFLIKFFLKANSVIYRTAIIPNVNSDSNRNRIRNPQTSLMPQLSQIILSGSFCITAEKYLNLIKKYMKRLFFLILVLIAPLLVYQYYPYSPMPNNVIIEKILVDKSERLLMVFSNGQVIKTYVISLGDIPIGPKEKQGDEKTPEGQYFINDKMGSGISGFNKNLGISYPEKKDLVNAQKKGFSTGGDIKIHGLKNGLGFIGKFQRWRDWTNGCLAITNEEMDDLYAHVKIGTPILINP